jgi:hypothetical protein
VSAECRRAARLEKERTRLLGSTEEVKSESATSRLFDDC